MAEIPLRMASRDGASEEQLKAVYRVMRILAEDDRERGAPSTRVVLCAACRRARQAAGAVNYDGTLLCNGCATDYEVLRMAAVVADLDAYFARPAATGG